MSIARDHTRKELHRGAASSPSLQPLADAKLKAAGARALTAWTGSTALDGPQQQQSPTGTATPPPQRPSPSRQSPLSSAAAAAAAAGSSTQVTALPQLEPTGSEVQSFGPAVIGGFWEEEFEDGAAPLRPEFLAERDKHREGIDREARRAERRAKLMGGLNNNMVVGRVEQPSISESAAPTAAPAASSIDAGDSGISFVQEQPDGTGAWYIAYDDYGNEYTSNHFPVKAALPQYEWLVPPTGPQHPGIIAAPKTARANRSPGVGMSYPLAGELLTIDPSNQWCLPKGLQLRAIKDARAQAVEAMMQRLAHREAAEAAGVGGGGGGEGGEGEGEDETDEEYAERIEQFIQQAAMSVQVDSQGLPVPKKPLPTLEARKKRVNDTLSSFAQEREAWREEERLAREAMERHVNLNRISGDHSRAAAAAASAAHPALAARQRHKPRGTACAAAVCML